MEPELEDQITTDAVESQDDVTTSTDDGDSLVEEELLVEEISIDGMCGVY